MNAASVDLKIDLLASITSFGRFLRAGGLKVGPGEILSAIEAVELVGVRDKGEFKWALQGTLVKQHSDIPFFDWAFEVFWQHPDRLQQTASALEKLAARETPDNAHRVPSPAPRTPTGRSDAPGQGDQAPKEEELSKIDLMAAYSPAELLRSKRFEEYSENELRQAAEILRSSDWSLGLRKTRRLRQGHKRYRLNLQHTIRKNVLATREFVKLAWQQRKQKPRPLVILCDISGSMERYSRILLHFMHTVSRALPRVESFTFGTRLTRITNLLRRGDAQQALEIITTDVPDWDGGTRIGATLKEFNFTWARRTLGTGAVVLVISDGWDTGEPVLLAAEMARLKRSCHRLIWLNPNLGYETFEPLTRGILAVLPYIDNFLPVHNLRSLLDLRVVLKAIGQSGVPTYKSSGDHPSRRRLGLNAGGIQANYTGAP